MGPLATTMKLAGVRRRLTQLVANSGGYNGTVLINLGRHGALLVDHDQVCVSKGHEAIKASLNLELPDLDQFLGGELTAQMLMMTRRLTISGRMGDALRFARHLEMAIHGRSALPA
jgi:putative sterol carrier protein